MAGYILNETPKIELDEVLENICVRRHEDSQSTLVNGTS